MTLWIIANRIAFAYLYKHKESDKLDNEELIQWDNLLKALPNNISQTLTKPKLELLVKYLTIKEIFDNENIKKILPDYVSKNIKIFLECSFMEKMLVGKFLRTLDMFTNEELVVFVSAIDQINRAVENNFKK